MKYYLADIQVYMRAEPDSMQESAVVHLTIGALRVKLVLNDRERQALAAALIRSYGPTETTWAHVDVTPLRLPANIRELNNDTLNVRTAEVPHEPIP